MIILDTHVWVRWLEPANGPLPPRLQTLLETAESLAVSAISCWEIAYLERMGRAILPLPLDEWLQAALAESDVQCLPLSGEIAVRAASLPLVHRDPADRFIIATALHHGAPLVSLDEQFRHYADLGALLLDS